MKYYKKITPWLSVLLVFVLVGCDSGKGGYYVQSKLNIDCGDRFSGTVYKKKFRGSPFDFNGRPHGLRYYETPDGKKVTLPYRQCVMIVLEEYEYTKGK